MLQITTENGHPEIRMVAPQWPPSLDSKIASFSGLQNFQSGLTLKLNADTGGNFWKTMFNRDQDFERIEGGSLFLPSLSEFQNTVAIC